MSLLVIDASVAAKWFLAEADSDAARRLLDGEPQFAAPDLLFAEVGNVLLKAVRRDELLMRRAARCLTLLSSVPMDLHPVAGLAADALQLAARCRLGFYDAVYAALAARTGAQLVTADESLARALRGHGLHQLVRWLGDRETQAS